jgi:hypothetical protein
LAPRSRDEACACALVGELGSDAHSLMLCFIEQQTDWLIVGLQLYLEGVVI